MKYRILGNTGLKVSSLGMGLMRLPLEGEDPSLIDEKKATRMVHRAIEAGVNYFDTAYPYHGKSFSEPGASEPFLGKALKKGHREKVLLATKLPCWLVESRQDMDRLLDEQLGRLETDYVDLYLLHALSKNSWKKMLDLGALEFLQDALKQGKIRHAGFSFHDNLDLFKEIVDAWDWTFTQIMYNYYDEDFQAGREGLSYAAARGLGVVAMEPLRGGALVNGLPAESKKILEAAAPRRSWTEWALRWLWDQKEVSVVLSGMSGPEHLEENLLLAVEKSETPMNTSDAEALEEARQVIKRLQRVSCTTCGYCSPCPEGVDIPRNFTFVNDHYMLSDPSARMRYHRLMSEKQRASACTQCGECEEKCPQQIPIRDELAHVADVFETG